MNLQMRTALVLAAGLLAGACSSTHYVTIRHPLHVGQVDPNSVPFNARRHERPRGLQAGTLVDEAQLTELSPERICLHTNIWALDEVDPGRGIYQNYQIALLNDQDNVENDAAQIMLEQPITQRYQGHIAQRRQVGTRSVCANWERRNRQRICTRYRQEPVYQTFYIPHIWQVTNHPANVCFPNGGFVTPSTTRVALEMDGPGAGRQVYEWQFESAVQQQQAQ